MAICLQAAMSQELPEARTVRSASVDLVLPEAMSAQTDCLAFPAHRRNKSPDNAWMRMRTPSPENTYGGYGGRGPPAPAETLLEYAPVFVQQHVVQEQQYITYKPMLCFVTPQGYAQADAETAMGSNDWRSLPSVGSWSTIKTGDVSSDDGGAWEADNFDMNGEPTAEAMVCPPCRDEEKEFASESSESNELPSKGSMNHPHSCAAACKYIKKPRGCKDGADCDRCHLCSFRNNKQHKKVAPRAERTNTEDSQDSFPPHDANGASRGRRGAPKGNAASRTARNEPEKFVQSINLADQF